MRINTDKKIMICLSYSILVTLEHKIYQIFVVGIVQCLEIERKNVSLIFSNLIFCRTIKGFYFYLKLEYIQ